MDEKMKKRSTEETEENIKNSKDQSNLDALLYDNEDEFIKEGSSADGKSFESFMSEYRNIMSRTLGTNADGAAEKTEEEMESEFLVSLPKSKSQKNGKRRSAPKVTKREDWDDGITLAPETYVNPGEEDSVLIEKFEEEEHTPDFNLGESVQDDSEKIQISINFNAEENNEVIEEDPGGQYVSHPGPAPRHLRVETKGSKPKQGGKSASKGKAAPAKEPQKPGYTGGKRPAGWAKPKAKPNARKGKR